MPAIEVPSTRELAGVIVRMRTSEYSGLVFQVLSGPLKVWPSGVRSQLWLGSGVVGLPGGAAGVLDLVEGVGEQVLDSTSIRAMSRAVGAEQLGDLGLVHVERRAGGGLVVEAQDELVLGAELAGLAVGGRRWSRRWSGRSPVSPLAGALGAWPVVGRRRCRRQERRATRRHRGGAWWRDDAASFAMAATCDVITGPRPRVSRGVGASARAKGESQRWKRSRPALPSGSRALGAWRTAGGSEQLHVLVGLDGERIEVHELVLVDAGEAAQVLVDVLGLDVDALLAGLERLGVDGQDVVALGGGADDAAAGLMPLPMAMTLVIAQWSLPLVSL
jgi:hypothetical protein